MTKAISLAQVGPRGGEMCRLHQEQCQSVGRRHLLPGSCVVAVAQLEVGQSRCHCQHAQGSDMASLPRCPHSEPSSHK